jgi:hypothetical protein
LVDAGHRFWIPLEEIGDTRPSDAEDGPEREGTGLHREALECAHGTEDTVGIEEQLDAAWVWVK